MNQDPKRLPVCRAAELQPTLAADRWLIDELWSERAVGIIGGEPKSCKSFLALDLAVAVASGALCLRRFLVRKPGRVLLFAAEDALPVVRERIRRIAFASGKDIEELDLHVITAPLLRLDLEDHRVRLFRTVEHLKPRLLILDPFVRLHRIDENAANEVAPLLAFLRQIERRLETAIVLVHHARKGAHHVRAGQALRGSSELHAWGDSNLYLRRKQSDLLLTIEHRAAPSNVLDLPLELEDDGEALALRVKNDPNPNPALPAVPLGQRIRDALDQANQPLSLRRLRELCRVRTATLCDTLDLLVRQGRVEQTPAGYVPGAW
jgi:hypothetical protein